MKNMIFQSNIKKKLPFQTWRKMEIWLCAGTAAAAVCCPADEVNRWVMSKVNQTNSGSSMKRISLITFNLTATWKSNCARERVSWNPINCQSTFSFSKRWSLPVCESQQKLQKDHSTSVRLHKFSFFMPLYMLLCCESPSLFSSSLSRFWPIVPPCRTN